MKSRGFTIVEALVVVAGSAIVLGLLLDVFIETTRQSEMVVENQNARQEAIIIAQRVEKVMRFRLPGQAPAEAAPAGAPSSAAMSDTSPPAAEDPLTTGPTSMDFVSTAPADTETSPPATPDTMTSAPPSVRAFLTTMTAQTAHPTDLFTSDTLRVRSLASGLRPEAIVHTISNEKHPEAQVADAVLQVSPDGTETTQVTTRRLGAHADRFHSQVSFRYASAVENLEGQYTDATDAVPMLVQYRVRVWPKRLGPLYETAVDSRGQSSRFEIISAVVLQ
jgi:type II secretory pathway pseudopilin PulG